MCVCVCVCVCMCVYKHLLVTRLKEPFRRRHTPMFERTLPEKTYADV